MTPDEFLDAPKVRAIRKELISAARRPVPRGRRRLALFAAVIALALPAGFAIARVVESDDAGPELPAEITQRPGFDESGELRFELRETAQSAAAVAACRRTLETDPEDAECQVIVALEEGRIEPGRYTPSELLERARQND